MTPAFLVRPATTADADVIVEFNSRLAFETEHKLLDLATLSRGVRAAMDDPDRLRYWVAIEPETHSIVGQSAVTREWSDWRDGWLWWLQSVYVSPDARGQGVFRALYAHIRTIASGDPGVAGIRLYVEKSNEKARNTYYALGMSDSGYLVLEESFSERTDSASVRSPADEPPAVEKPGGAAGVDRVGGAGD